jgi:hypothetical protein
VQVAVHVDQVPEAELARESVRSAERLGGEPRQVLDMAGLTVADSGCSSGSASTLT